jgi:transposase-like protein
MAALAIPENNKSMRYNLIFIMIAVIVIACKPVKKVQSIQTAMGKKDTAQTIVVKENAKVDSATLVKEIMSKVMGSKIDFSTFKSKIKVDYEGPNESQHVTAYIGIKKDSVMLIKIVGPLGIVGLEVRITKDSVVLVNKVDKWVKRRSVNYLQDVSEIPFNFSTLQDILIGNPVFLNSNVVSYQSGARYLSVLMVGDLFKHLVTLDKSDFKVLHSKLDDIDVQRNRTCDITFGNYELKNGRYFSTYRKIAVAEKSKLDINLDFKQYSFNEPLSYTFEVPKNYKRK